MMKRNRAGVNRRNFLRNVALGGAGVTLYGWGARAVAYPAPADGAMAAAARRKLPLNPQWRFQKEEAADSTNPPPADIPKRAAADFDDRAWDAVGVPHCYNDLDTYQNGNFSATFQGNAWYRNRFQLDASAQGKKIFLEFLGVNIGTAVYVNGKLKPGNTAVPQPGQVTHVGDFLPFVLDVTNDVRPGAENVLAVRVGNISGNPGYNHDKTPLPYVGTSFYTPPGFGTKIDFGMGCGGIVCPVSLYTTSMVHVPANAYSPLQKWGTHVGTVSASAETARVRIQTNVENEGTSPAEVTLVTRILDVSGHAVATVTSEPRSIPSGETGLFDQTTDLARPQLWWPNNSRHGRPYLYRVVSDVQTGGATVDSVESPLGVRMITWDDDYCYVNGEKHLLNGFGHRNLYPALGSAIPADLQWKDVKLMADAGANLLRVGHVPAFVETVKACDALGIMVLMNSGDNEWSLKGEPAITYKKEYDRDMIIRFRNHPSVVAWESNNGLSHYSPKETMAIVNQWDFIQPRIVGSRDKSDYFPTDRKIMIGYTNSYKKVKSSPSLNWEAYFGDFHKDKATGKQNHSFVCGRFDYADEKTTADRYVTDYQKNIRDQAAGWIAWMLEETQGEGYLTYLNGMSHQKSLGSCALDQNRFPKLTYQIYKNALWVPFSIRPGVALQSHWNLSGDQDVDAWSNCPKVELFLNGVSKGTVVPNEKLRCTWKAIPWESGTLKVVGMDNAGRPACTDLRATAGAPRHILLTVEPPTTKPSGEIFRITANGSDAVLVTAQVVDANGVWCPLADNNIRFTVTGAGTYRGSANFYVTPDKPLTYHAPGDPELQAEGGLMRVAIRTGFAPGVVQVKAEADGLKPGLTSFAVEPLGA